MRNRRSYYFDYYATTIVDQKVMKAMNRCSQYFYGNPSSYHREGEKSLVLFNKFKYVISNFIHCNSDEIVFTSGATESNNILIRGLIEYFLSFKKKIHIIAYAYEHESVLNILKYFIRKKLISVDFFYPDNKGLINTDEIEKFINKDTIMVIMMHVQHIVGIIHDIESVAKICFKYSIYFHVDASQSYGKIPVKIHRGITSLSASGHKIYAPKGIGILFVSKKYPRPKLKNVYFGGGQQRGFKSGTIPLELCCAFVSATRICYKTMEEEKNRLKKLQLSMHVSIMKELDNVLCNGIFDSNLMFNILSYIFLFIEGESILGLMYNYCISTGSACNSDNLEASPIIEYLNGGDNAHSSIRISIGRYTTEEGCKKFTKQLIKTVKYLRSCSPVNF